MWLMSFMKSCALVELPPKSKKGLKEGLHSVINPENIQCLKNHSTAVMGCVREMYTTHISSFGNVDI